MNKVIIVFYCLMVSMAYGMTYIVGVDGFKKHGPPQPLLTNAVKMAKALFPKGEVVECVAAMAFPKNYVDGAPSRWLLFCYTNNATLAVSVDVDEAEITHGDASAVIPVGPMPQFTLDEALKMLSEQTQGIPINATFSFKDSWSFIVLSGTNVIEFVVDQREGISEREWRSQARPIKKSQSMTTNTESNHE